MFLNNFCNNYGIRKYLSISICFYENSSRTYPISKILTKGSVADLDSIRLVILVIWEKYKMGNRIFILFNTMFCVKIHIFQIEH